MTPNRVVYDFLMHITLPVSFVYLYNCEHANRQRKFLPQIHPTNEEKNRRLLMGKPCIFQFHFKSKSIPGFLSFP